MMGQRIKMISGNEYKALTKGGRRYHYFQVGERAWVKRKFRRRERHQLRATWVRNQAESTS